MSVAVWPSELPCPLRRTLSGQRVDGRLSKPGPTRGYRRQFSNVPKIYALSVAVTRSGKAVLDQFVDETLKGGALPFYMPDPVTDGWAMLTSEGAPMLMADGTPMLLAAQWLCLFEDLPSEQPYGRGFEIAFSVAVMP